MPSVEPGNYRLYNARNTTVSMTVYHAQAKNGANVKLAKNGDPEKDTSFADVWQLSYRADGTAQLINVYAGKSLDVAGGKFANKTNVQIWTDNDSRAQAWDIVPSATGKTVTIVGTSYPTYFLQLHAAPTFVADAQGYDGAANRNVQLYTKESNESTTDQLWAFVPVPAMEDGAIYDVRSMLSKGMALDVAASSNSNGAAVQLSKANGHNNQKWLLTKHADAAGETPAQWTLRALHSGKNLDSYGGKDKKHDGQRIVQWDWNAGLGQVWDIQRLGTASLGGKSCDVVSIRTMMTGKDNPYYIDAYDALHSNKAWLKLKKPSSTLSQQFALVPTTSMDGFVPVPTGIGLAESVGSTATSDGARVTTTPIPTWTCTKGWSPSGPNHYEVSMRSRDKDATSAAWQAWGEWSAWSVAPVTVRNGRAWLTQGIPSDMRSWRLSGGETRLTEVEIQVRCVVCDSQGITHGPAADKSVYLYDAPTVTLGECGFSPEGIRVAYTSDWSDGSTTIRVDSVMGAGGEMLAEPVTVRGLDDSGTILLPRESMAPTAPTDGGAYAVRGGVGYDEWGERDGTAGTLTQQATIAYTAGLTVTPTCSVGEGRTLAVEFHAQAGGTNRLWLDQGGRLRELDGTVTGGKARFEVPVPFGRGVRLWADATSADGDRWGVASVTLQATDEPLSLLKPCHAWSFGDGKNFYLETNQGAAIETDRKLTPEYNAYSLDSRGRQSVFFGPTTKGEFTAEGTIVLGDTPLGPDDSDPLDVLDALNDAHHATYRAPSGEMCDVAITSVSYTRHRTWAAVSISMIEEA